MRDSLHVDTASRDVSRDEHAGSATAKIVERMVARVLRLVAVDHRSRDTHSDQLLVHLVRPVLGAREHQAAGDLRASQQPLEQRALLRLVDEVKHLVDALRGGDGRGDGDVRRIVQQRLGEAANLRSDGGGEEKHLPDFWKL